MDIAGAKALRERLGSQDKDGSDPASVDVPEDAPPVFRWLGVSNASSGAAAGEPTDTPESDGVSMFRRLGLSFR